MPHGAPDSLAFSVRLMRDLGHGQLLFLRLSSVNRLTTQRLRLSERILTVGRSRYAAGAIFSIHSCRAQINAGELGMHRVQMRCDFEFPALSASEVHSRCRCRRRRDLRFVPLRLEKKRVCGHRSRRLAAPMIANRTRQILFLHLRR